MFLSDSCLFSVSLRQNKKKRNEQEAEHITVCSFYIIGLIQQCYICKWLQL